MDEFRMGSYLHSGYVHNRVLRAKEKAEELLLIFQEADDGEDFRIAKERLKEAVMWATRAFTANAENLNEKVKKDEAPEVWPDCKKVHQKNAKDFFDFLNSITEQK